MTGIEIMSNRIIKFRLWKIKEKKFASLKDLSEKYLLMLDGTLCIHEYEARELNSEDYVIQEFTGLKDKNGREIYDGDILTGDSFDYNYKVEYEPGMFFLKNPERLDFRYALAAWGNKCQVIGNIFQNPKLLKCIKINT